MSSLQPLYDVKERLEYAAIAGTNLLGEDFRLQRSAEAMKPLAAASPVFGKISAGLDQLLAAPGEQRPGLLLDVLGLVDAVAYTQGGSGLAGDMQDLPIGGGAYREISYSQIQPLLTALTTTGGGRLEVIQTNWETHPEYFSDFRVLPALVNGLGDGYGEISNFNAELLKKLGPIVLPLLKADFDPSGKRGMARRVEVIAAVEKEGATPWLQAILPEAKKDVRTAVLAALGIDARNTGMLLELAKTERGNNREAVLSSLADQDGEEVRSFWGSELKTNGDSVKFMRRNQGDWAAKLVVSGLRERLEGYLSGGGAVPQKKSEELTSWCYAIGKKATPTMLEFWRWACGRMDSIDGLKNEKGNSILLGVRLSDCLLEALCANGPGPVCDFCLTLWPEHPNTTRYLIHSFLAALMVRPAAEVYETFSPYILTEDPTEDIERKITLNNVLLRAFTWVLWHRELKRYCMQEDSAVRFESEKQRPGIPTAGPLDPRWIDRLTHAAYKEGIPGYCSPFSDGCVVSRFTAALMNLTDRDDPEMRARMVPYLKDWMLNISTASKGIQENQFSVFAYSRYLIQLGASPRGVLGEAMARFPGKYQAVFFWQQLSQLSQALPPEEAARMVEEIDIDLCFNFTQMHNVPLSTMLRQAVPFAAASLRAGQPFPEWNEIVKFQK